MLAVDPFRVRLPYFSGNVSGPVCARCTSVVVSAIPGSLFDRPSPRPALPLGRQHPHHQSPQDGSGRSTCVSDMSRPSVNSERSITTVLSQQTIKQRTLRKKCLSLQPVGRGQRAIFDYFGRNDRWTRIDGLIWSPLVLQFLTRRSLF